MDARTVRSTPRRRWILACTAALLFTMAAPVCAGPRPSLSHPNRLAFLRDPQTLYVRPGNSAVTLFADVPTSDPSNLQPWQDEYCNARWITLAPPASSRLQLTARWDAQSTDSYWARMTEWLGSMTISGNAALWIIDDAALEIYSREPALADTMASFTRHLATLDIFPPALVFKVNRHPSAAAQLRADLKAAGFPGAMGIYLSAGTTAPQKADAWDFTVCEEEVIPAHYRGQAAAAWVRSRAGQDPVIISPAQYDFLRDVVWMGCGAAGIWYRPLPPPSSPENRAAAIHLRASTAFLNRFPGATIPLMPRWNSDAFAFCLENPHTAWAAFIPENSKLITIPAPAELGGKLVGQSWYNPATDQTIIAPLTRLPASVSVQPPDANLWVYSISAALPGAENRTTVTAIRDWSY